MMEALRTKMDSLLWEVNRLDAENKRLRADNSEAGERADLEMELEQSRKDVADLTSRFEACKEELAARQRENQDGSSGREGQGVARKELDRLREDLRVAGEQLAKERDKTTTLTAEVTALETEVDELHATCQRLEAEAADHSARAERELATTQRPERGGTRELSPLGDRTDQMGGPRAAHGRPVGAAAAWVVVCG